MTGENSCENLPPEPTLKPIDIKSDIPHSIANIRGSTTIVEGVITADFVETIAVVDRVVNPPSGWQRIHTEHGFIGVRKGVEYSMFIPDYDMKEYVVDGAIHAFGINLLHVVRLGIRPMILYDATSKLLVSGEQLTEIKRLVKSLGASGEIIMQGAMSSNKCMNLYLLPRGVARHLITKLELARKVTKDGQVTLEY